MNSVFIYAKSVFIVLVLSASIPLDCIAQNGDISLLRDINHNRNKSFEGAFTAVTNSAFPLTAAIPVTELVIGYVRDDKKMKQYGWQTAECVGINALMTTGLKYAINRMRPFVTYPDIIPLRRDADPSFPSGHTSFAFCDATSLAICFPRWYVIVPAYSWAATVGYSRLYLGMHYPTDVLAGAVVGSGSAWLAYKCNRWLRHKKLAKKAIEN